MPYFPEENLQEFELPSSTPDDKAIVTIDLTVYGGMAEDVFDENGQVHAPASSIISNAIKSWNFTDRAGNIVPITRDTVRKLSPEDFNFISEKIMPQLGVSAKAQVTAVEKKD